MESLLLRLFKSEFFNPWIAVAYLSKYDDLGIQAYLCERIEEFSIDQIEEILPQLCHLVMTKPKGAIFIGKMLINIAVKSLHAAMMMLWYIECYYAEYKVTKKSQHKMRARRMILELREVLSKPGVGNFKNENRKIYIDNQESLLPGIGCVAGSIAQPEIFKSSLKIAIAHGTTPPWPEINPNSKSTVKQKVEEKKQLESLKSKSYSKSINIADFWDFKTPPLEEFHNGGAFSINRYISRLRNYNNIGSFLSKSKSNNSIESMKVQTTLNQNEKIFFDIGHHYYSEMEFIKSLIAISNRLTRIPKEARQGALRAELNLFNHNLPANICIPIWCKKKIESGSENSSYHHKILHLPPHSSKILNSAQRIPFQLLIEILEDEPTSSILRLRKDMGIEKDSLLNLKTLENSKINNQLEIEKKTDFEESRKLSIEDSQIEFNSNGLENLNDRLELEIIKEKKNENLSIFNSVNDIKTAEVLTNEEKVKEIPFYGLSKQDFPIDFAERMRTAAILLAQLQELTNKDISALAYSAAKLTRAKIIKEMANLEVQRITQLAASGQKEYISSAIKDCVNSKETKMNEKKIRPYFRSHWEETEIKIRNDSPYGHLPNWKLLSVIFKNGSDLRQELLAIQIIKIIKDIWEEEGLDLWVCPFKILVTSESSGLIETIKDAYSIHSIRKESYKITGKLGLSIREYFLTLHGPEGSLKFEAAREAFIRSLAGYSLVTYILALKDRHNGNILIDSLGHIIHIDFGFMLSNSPGYVGFETAPFKLTLDYVDLLGGPDSKFFNSFKKKLFYGLLALRKHSERIILPIQVMLPESTFPCFYSGEIVLQNLRERLHLGFTDSMILEYIDQMIATSTLNMFTRLYDTFQYYSNGIM